MTKPHKDPLELMLEAAGLQGDHYRRSLEAIDLLEARQSMPREVAGRTVAQVAATGTLQGRQVNVLREYGLDVLDEVATMHSVTSEDTQRALGRGEITFSMFLSALLAAL